MLRPVWFLDFQKAKSWLQLDSGKIVSGELFCDGYKHIHILNKKL